MKTKNLENYLKSFGKQVANRAKSNLQKAKGGGTDLEKSIDFKVVKDATGYTVEFVMANYGTFVDKGVSGNSQVRKYKDYQNKTLSSPYKYTTKQPPPDILAKWISKKGIKGRDEKTGRFISNMSLAFIMGRAIKRDGIQGISFFQKPLGLGLKQFGKGLLGIIKEDILESLTTVK
jgi:hypothetical protein|tara:strand:- start:4947 stop:5474 length:528 start_codon:yes stop_codon:yes gene_type:complete